jgi:hypothetical protein
LRNEAAQVHEIEQRRKKVTGESRITRSMVSSDLPFYGANLVALRETGGGIQHIGRAES